MSLRVVRPRTSCPRSADRIPWARTPDSAPRSQAGSASSVTSHRTRPPVFSRSRIEHQPLPARRPSPPRGTSATGKRSLSVGNPLRHGGRRRARRGVARIARTRLVDACRTTATRLGAAAGTPAVRRHAVIAPRLGRALEHPGRVRATADDEARLATGRPRRAAYDLALAALVDERRLRLTGGAAYVGAVGRCPGTVAVRGDRIARGRDVRGIGPRRIAHREPEPRRGAEERDPQKTPNESSHLESPSTRASNISLKRAGRGDLPPGHGRPTSPMEREKTHPRDVRRGAYTHPLLASARAVPSSSPMSRS